MIATWFSIVLTRCRHGSGKTPASSFNAYSSSDTVPISRFTNGTFLGDRDCVSTFLSSDPLVKLATVVERLPLHNDVPVAIRRQREALKFDYGKFDFIRHQDGPVLIDANRTPNEGPTPRVERVDAICAALADGIAGFLG
jgi:hypothetical protein